MGFGLIFLIFNILCAADGPKSYRNLTESFIPATKGLEETFKNQTAADNITVTKLG